MTRLCVWYAGIAMAGALTLSAIAAAPEAEQLAGEFTVARFDDGAYSQPAAGLDRKQRQFFMVGRNLFHRQWASIVSLNGDWGLGPTFIADRCSACHVNAGRGAPPAGDDEQLLSMLVRISIPGADERGGPRPHPHYGDQLQNRALDGRNIDLQYGPEAVPPEADLHLQWTERTVTFADGERVVLRQPSLRIENLNFGPLGPEVMYSLRIAQPIFGLGLLDAVSESEILKIARKQQAQGFNGRPNYVWDAVAGKTALGRYGWKANQASLRQQIAAAALGDMGVVSNLFPDQNCPPIQLACTKTLPGNFPEIIDHEIDALEIWLRGLAVPVRRNGSDPIVSHGEQLFHSARCSVCHLPELKTASHFSALPQLSNRKFQAFTDLLLHDMGVELADGRPEFRAGARDWRTQPLWGIGLSEVVSGSSAMLHDGRARNVTEAILWHGGEAEVSREAFRAMAKRDREALVKFVNSI